MPASFRVKCPERETFESAFEFIPYVNSYFNSASNWTSFYALLFLIYNWDSSKLVSCINIFVFCRSQSETSSESTFGNKDWEVLSDVVRD